MAFWPLVLAAAPTWSQMQAFWPLKAAALQSQQNERDWALPCYGRLRHCQIVKTVLSILHIGTYTPPLPGMTSINIFCKFIPSACPKREYENTYQRKQSVCPPRH